jgi:hypothetical protein
VACMQAAVGDEFDACADRLTDPQEEAVKTQLEATIEPLMNRDAMRKDEAKASAPAEAMPPPPTPAPDDPCGGGE